MSNDTCLKLHDLTWKPKERSIIDIDYLLDILLRLLAVPSPTGYTDNIVHMVGKEFEKLGIEFEVTRRGAMRAGIPGKISTPDKAIVGHLDTLGALVKRIKDNGRLELVPVGTWSSRFAEGGRVSILGEHAVYRGTILPCRASGHIFDKAIDEQPVSWDHVELRLDEIVHSRQDCENLGIEIGDMVALDPQPEIIKSGFINSRYLDNKAGVATMLAAAKALVDNKDTLPVDCHLLLTISEEVGSGASHILHQDVAEMVTVDNGTVGQGQNSSEFGVTMAMADSSGPFDYHLIRHMLKLCEKHKIPVVRDIFKYYRCDSASAVEAGNDIRTGLITFGVDASHGYERTHIDALYHVSLLLYHYMLAEPIFTQAKSPLTDLNDFLD